jgi:hypothetical protein
MELLVVLTFSIGVIRDVQQLNSRFGIDGWDVPHYVMHLLLSARSVRARVPESLLQDFSEPADGGLYESQK